MTNQHTFEHHETRSSWIISSRKMDDQNCQSVLRQNTLTQYLTYETRTLGIVTTKNKEENKCLS